MKLSTYRNPAAFVSAGSPLPMDGYIMYRCLQSFKAFVRADDYVIGGHLAFDGFWEPHVTRAFIEMLDVPKKEGASFCDLGANSGYYSMIAAHLGYHVTAVEADPRNARLLRLNSRTCGRRFLVREGVVGTKGRPVMIIEDPYSSNSAMAIGDGNIKPIKVPEADIYKIDLEGGDEAVIQEIMARPTQPSHVFFEYAPQRYDEEPNYLLDHWHVYKTATLERLFQLPLVETDLILQPK